MSLSLSLSLSGTAWAHRVRSLPRMETFGTSLICDMLVMLTVTESHKLVATGREKQKSRWLLLSVIRCKWTTS